MGRSRRRIVLVVGGFLAMAAGACGASYSGENGPGGADASVDGSTATNDATPGRIVDGGSDADPPTTARRFCATIDADACEDFDEPFFQGFFDLLPTDTETGTVGVSAERATSSPKSVRSATDGGAGPSGNRKVWMWEVGIPGEGVSGRVRAVSLLFDLFIDAHPESSSVMYLAAVGGYVIQIDAYADVGDPERARLLLQPIDDRPTKPPTPPATSPSIVVPLKQWLAIRVDLELVPTGLHQRLTVAGCCTSERLNDQVPAITSFHTNARVALGAYAGAGGSHDLLYYDNARVLFQR